MLIDQLFVTAQKTQNIVQQQYKAPLDLYP